MTAVSQSYPNYLGGLNEQPDELKKPGQLVEALNVCLLYTSPSPRDRQKSRMPSSA